MNIWPMRGVKGVSVGITLSLAACTQLKKVEDPVLPPVPALSLEQDLPTRYAPITEAAVPDPRPRIRPTLESVKQREAEAEAAALAAAQQKPDLATLIGLDFIGVEKMFGPADKQSEVPPGKEWEYWAGSCRLVVRFYPDLKTLAFSVLSYTVTDEEIVTTEAARTDGATKNGTVRHEINATSGSGNETATPISSESRTGVIREPTERDKRCRSRISTRIQPNN